MTTRNRELAGIIDDSGNITTGGNLTVSGSTTTVSSTVETHADPLIELNTGAGSNSNDLGFVFERGSTGDNACLIWDESNDVFAVGTTTATGTSTGNMSFTVAGLTAGVGTFSSLDISGDADMDGTLEADAITVNGTTLSETIADTVGAMVSSNTESGITVAYQDADNTLDFTVGTLNQDTTGTAATVTDAAQTNITRVGSSLGIGLAPTHNFNLSSAGAVEARFASTDNDTYLQISSDTDEGQDSVLQFLAGTGAKGSIVYDHHTTAATQKMILKTGDNAVSAMTILGDGKVGIGTASPSADLHLYHTDGDRPHLLLENYGNRGTGDAPILEFYLNDQTTGGIGDDTQVGVITFAGDEKDGGTKEIYGQIRGIANDPGSGSSNKGAIDFMIQKDGTLTQTMILKNGLVGIGTGSPATILDIKNPGDSTYTGGLLIRTGASTSEASSLYHDNGSSTTTVLANRYDSAAAAIKLILRASSGSPVTALTALGSGNVGIGTTSPAETLHVKRADGTALIVESSNDQNNTGDRINIEFRTDAAQGIAKIIGGKEGNYQSAGARSGYLAFQTINANSYTERMRITSSGNVGIGTTSPSGKLHVDGTSYFTNTMHMSGSGNLQFAGGIYPTFIRDGNDLDLRRQDTGAVMVTFTTGGATVASDERLKENITTITEATSKLKQLRGVTHTWKESMQDPDNADSVSYGLIAQEVEKVIPEVVHTSNSGEGYKSVNYEKLVPLLIETIKELEARIETLEG